MKSNQPAKSTSNIHGLKLILWICWDQKGVLYHELLKSGQMITAELYWQQLIRLKQTIVEKRPELATGHEELIFHHARPHVAVPVKNYLEYAGWEIHSSF